MHTYLLIRYSLHFRSGVFSVFLFFVVVFVAVFVLSSDLAPSSCFAILVCSRASIVCGNFSAHTLARTHTAAGCTQTQPTRILCFGLELIAHNYRNSNTSQSSLAYRAWPEPYVVIFATNPRCIYGETRSRGFVSRTTIESTVPCVFVWWLPIDRRANCDHSIVGWCSFAHTRSLSMHLIHVANVELNKFYWLELITFWIVVQYRAALALIIRITV